MVTAGVCVISSQDNPSTDLLESITQGLGDTPLTWVYAGLDGNPRPHRPQPLQRVSAGHVGLVAGRHRALEAVNADVIVYLDDDVILARGALERILEPFGDPQVHFVGCRYLPYYEQEPPPWLTDLWQVERDGFRTFYQLSLLDGGETSRLFSPRLVWGLCFAVRRDTVIKLGGFHPDGYPWELRRFRGDGETGLAVLAESLGLKAYYQGQTHVLHRVPASRMTPQYLERRSFLEGISSSYAQVRRNARIPPQPDGSWRDVIRPAKRKLDRLMAFRSPTTSRVHRLMVVAHEAGMRYHEEELRNDPKLLEWVLRPNYFDYTLPEGWEGYCRTSG